MLSWKRGGGIAGAYSAATGVTCLRSPFTMTVTGAGFGLVGGAGTA